jgi:hypothetical protein
MVALAFKFMLIGAVDEGGAIDADDNAAAASLPA